MIPPSTDTYYRYHTKLITELEYLNLKASGLHHQVERFVRISGGGAIDDLNKALSSIVNFFKLLVKILEWLWKFIKWIGFILVWIFKDLLPSIPSDLFNAIKHIIYVLLFSPIEFIGAAIKRVINIVGTSIFGTFWGSDNIKNTKNTDKNKCYKSANGTVPFSIIVGTIICPPIGVFMEYGITGWINIIICGLLTLVFYFPGLIYALTIIYS